MNRELRIKFSKALCSMEGKNYIQSMIAFSAAPTIEGKKPSSLMTFNSQGKNSVALWRRHGLEICEFFELEQFELKSGNDCVIVLLYRKKILELYVNHRRNQPFLERMGYGSANDLEHKLQMLRQQFEELCPHEVGIFLGIPVEDVEGFIEHKGKNCLLCRYWKVYGNTQHAELLFRAYDKARGRMAEFVVNTNENWIAECIYN